MFKQFPSLYYANIEIINATINPVTPTRVSIIVHVFRVVFSSIPTSDFTSQKPESLKWEQTVAPPATAAVVHARYSEGKLCNLPEAATIPAAIVMATVEEPTLILTRAATTKATTTIGRFAEETASPITSPKSGILQHIAEHTAAGSYQKDKTCRLQRFCHNLFQLFGCIAVSDSKNKHCCHCCDQKGYKRLSQKREHPVPAR